MSKDSFFVDWRHW